MIVSRYRELGVTPRFPNALFNLFVERFVRLLGFGRLLVLLIRFRLYLA